MLDASLRSAGVADYEDRLHAVRSSLAGMSGALRVLTDQRRELPEASSRRLETLLVEELERLRRLVAPTPHDGDAERGGEDLDVDSLVARVALARRMAGQEVAWDPSGCRVRAVADDVVEVLNILLVNAWRHASGSPARIDVTSEGSTTVLTVSDNGPGVPPELREAIFERGVCRPGSPGQGLGLAMARSLVEGLGGSLTLVPTEGAGACFRVTLPAAVREEAA